MMQDAPYETMFGKIPRYNEQILFAQYEAARQSEYFLIDYPGLTGDWDHDRLRWEILQVRKDLAKLRGNL